MSSEKKTISINPDLFQLSGKTKKSKPTKEKIKMKPNQLSDAKNNTLKRKILKVIRAKQQDEYKRLFSKPREKNESKNEKQVPTVENEFDKDFDKSLKYLTDLEKKVKNENVVHNHTFRNYDKINGPVELPVFNELPKEFNLQMPSQHVSPSPLPHMLQPPPQPKYNFPQHPGYGCLKGGKIPTFRTIKNRQGIIQQIPVYNEQKDKPILENSNEPQPNPMEKVPTDISPIQYDNDKSDKSDKSELLKAQFNKQAKTEKTNYNRMKNMKRKKIYKRTYRVGKSKTKIGCLISNKTIRQKIQQSAYELKHTNIKDVRKFLLKRGFIKVGTTAPNDVLRKMYESVAMVCGEVQNHNPENLLHNFINEE
jgi:hypothetical protein